MSNPSRGTRFSVAATVAGGVLLAGTIAAAIFPATQWLPAALGILAAVALVVALASGIRLNRSLQSERDKLQYCDLFTGMPNGPCLERDYRALPVKKGRALVLIQLNDFFRLNSLFGVESGGETIRRLRAPMEAFAQAHGGKAYRLTLDNFCLLVPYESEGQIMDELRPLFAKMEQVYVEDKHVTYSYHYTFTYGVYLLDEGDQRADTVSEVLMLTYLAVQHMPSTGATQGTVFNEQTKPDWELQEQLRARLKSAWGNREFVPYYQMVYDLKTGKPVGAELLTRWQHPDRGLVLPKDFLPVMESEGLIMDLDLYMLEEACKKIQGWINAELVTVPLSVNLSKLNIHRQDFVERLIKLVDSYDIPPILIELELTEAVLLYEKNDAFLELTRQLHEHGFTLSMDNFAENDFSSINLLRELPIDVIKISSRFFKNVQIPRERTFILNTLRMAKELGIKVVAMGVETEQQAALYKQLGCNLGQGFYFSRPMSNEDFEKQIF